LDYQPEADAPLAQKSPIFPRAYICASQHFWDCKEYLILWVFQPLIDGLISNFKAQMSNQIQNPNVKKIFLDFEL